MYNYIYKYNYYVMVILKGSGHLDYVHVVRTRRYGVSDVVVSEITMLLCSV